jgi:zinc/manganese transport system permease protein
MFDRWLILPLLMCLALTAIHGYLGIHVLTRKVIFVDLAMAQVAALGVAVAILLGYDPRHEENGVPVHLFSLGFTLVGAALFSLTRMRRERVPHEALIGVIYAGASALALLILSKSPVEGEQIKHMLVGSLLTVKGERVAITAAIYAAIGIFHWLYREKFFMISADPEAAQKAGINVRFWDFLFYVTFGIVITSSVSIGGVLLVFSYLVVPGIIAMLFAERTRTRILVAWGVGVGVSIGAILISNAGDFPTGPSIVVAFAAALVIAGLIGSPARLAAGCVVTALAIWGMTFLRKEEVHEHHEDEFTRLVQALKSDDIARQMDAIDHLADARDPHAAPAIVELLKRTSSDMIIEHAAHALAKLQSVEALPVLKEIASHDLDPLLRVDLARSILDLRDPGGLAILMDVLEKDSPEEAHREALALIRERTRQEGDLPALKRWWIKRGPSLRWRGESRRFE